MDLYLDGDDWQAGYFLDDDTYQESIRPRRIANMLMDSAGSWGMFANTPREGLYRATVPGCDRSVLRENGELPELYFGRNLERTKWCEEKSWCFRKDFFLPETWQECRGIRLSFLSAGYQGRVFLNESFLGYCEGMFVPWSFDVTNVLKPGEPNHLIVVFDPAPQAHPGHHSDQPADFSYYHFCQMCWGWDWSRHFVPSGIFDHVILHGTQEVRLRDCLFQTTKNHVKLTVELGALAEVAAVPLQIILEPQNHDGKSIELTEHPTLHPGQVNTVVVEFDVPDAKFWFPNGYGEQFLYQLKLRVPGDELIRQVGFRELKMVRNPQSPEEAYPLTFEINGQRIFARGANWVPADLVFSDITAEVYEREVRLAAEAGFNLLRVWGGGLIEKDDFYAACDRYGILVWQEFMHACSCYPTDGLYLARKKCEGEYAIRKMRNHVAMAMYCGGNEVQYYGDRPDNPLYVQYRQLVEQLAPGMPYHVSSPDLSREGERDHGPWKFLDHGFWNQHRRLLASEFGCNSLAEVDSLDRFIAPNDPCPDGQQWKYHFTYTSGARSIKPMEELFALTPGNRYTYSQASMFMQSEVLGYVMEHYRREFPRSSGAFVWQYNESWPTNAFSIVDYYTLPKMAYYRLRRANAPVMVFLEENSWQITDHQFCGKLYLCNDHAPLTTAEIRVSGRNLRGAELFRETFHGNFASGVTTLGEISRTLPDDLPGNILIVQLEIQQGSQLQFENERFYAVPDFHAAFNLPETTLTVQRVAQEQIGAETKVTLAVTNTGAIAALNVRCRALDKAVKACFWADNYRTVMPGETRKFAVAIQGELPPEFEVSAWNFPAKKF